MPLLLPMHPHNALTGTLAALLFATGACSGETAESRTPAGAAQATVAGRQLVSRQVDSSGELAIPTDMALVGKYLVLLNTRGDPVIRVYDMPAGRFVRGFGREGSGPGEFQAAWSLDAEPGSRSAVWIFDIGLQRFTRVDLERDFQPGSSLGSRSVRIDASAPITAPVWSGDSLLVSTGFFRDGGRLAQLDRTGRLLRIVGDDPPGGDETPMQVRQHAYQSTLRPNPRRSLFALGTRHADRLEILRMDGSRVASAARPAKFEPVYKSTLRAGEPTMDSGDEMRFGYIDLATTSDRIYALYSGRKRADFPGEANFGEFVHVYDWNARLVEVIQLDAPAISIAADEARQTLYAVRHHPRPALVVYDLRAAPSN